MGVIVVTQFVVFKLNEDKDVDVYINNKLHKQLHLDEFTDCRSIKLNVILYDFISSKPTSEKCDIHGPVIITSSNELGAERTITIRIGDKRHSMNFDNVGTNVFYSDIIRYIYDTMSNMDYAKLYEVARRGDKEMALANTAKEAPILILNRLVNFFPVNVDTWESERFYIFGESIYYNILEATYNLNDKKIVDTAKLHKEGENKIYTIKRFSFVNGVSTNIISSDQSIYTLTKATEEDLFKYIIKNCSDKYNVTLLNTMISIVTTIDTIIEPKTYSDNELYDYVKLRDYICRFIEYYGEIKYTTSKLISATNYILNSFNKKKDTTHDNIQKIERWIMILLSIETEKERQSGKHTNTPNLLSEALKMLNFSK
jgi:hypothetical protein